MQVLDATRNTKRELYEIGLRRCSREPSIPPPLELLDYGTRPRLHYLAIRHVVFPVVALNSRAISERLRDRGHLLDGAVIRIFRINHPPFPCEPRSVLAGV